MRSMQIATDRKQSLGEEIPNSISHGIGLIAAIAGAPFLIMRAAGYGDAGFIAGASLFSATTILLYLASTLYHALTAGNGKRVFRIIEHCAILLLIAGSYMPFALGILRGAWGWTILGIIWGLALAGVGLKIFARTSYPAMFTGLYLAMGWVIVIAVKPLLIEMPVAGLIWLIAGGVILHHRSGLFCHRFVDEIRSFYLAPVCSFRHHMSLLCRALVCALILNLDRNIRIYEQIRT